MPDFDAFLELLPADGPDLDPDEALAAAMQDAADVSQAAAPKPFGRGHVFDFATGQFETYGSEPKAVTELAQLRAWIEKTLRTGRFAHPIYSDDYGVDVVDLYGRPPTPELFAAYAAAVEDALLVHDRISAVTDFVFNFEPDDDLLEVGFTVVIDEGDEAQTLNIDPIAVGG